MFARRGSEGMNYQVCMKHKRPQNPSLKEFNQVDIGIETWQRR